MVRSAHGLSVLLLTICASFGLCQPIAHPLLNMYVENTGPSALQLPVVLLPALLCVPRDLQF